MSVRMMEIAGSVDEVKGLVDRFLRAGFKQVSISFYEGWAEMDPGWPVRGDSEVRADPAVAEPVYFRVAGELYVEYPGSGWPPKRVFPPRRRER